MKRLTPLLLTLSLLSSCNETKEPTPPDTEATTKETTAAKDRPAFAGSIDYTSKEDEKRTGGWVWVAPDSLAPGTVRNMVKPPDDSATFQLFPKVKYVLRPTFVKHEDGLDHWELAMTATTSTEESGEATSEHAIQIAFDGTTPITVFEDDFTTMEVRPYKYAVDLGDGSEGTKKEE